MDGNPAPSRWKGAPAPQLERRLGLLQATALNMANMVGVGPFITIPFIVKELPGPQVMIGWALGLLLALCDSMMWCELGAALPGSGGTFHYLREVFRTTRLGRILPFLFIWSFLFSGPLEVASGCIGFVTYLHELWPADWHSLLEPLMDPGKPRGLSIAGKIAASGLVGVAVLLLYRRIDSIGKLTVLLWTGMVVTVLLVIATAAAGFDPARAFAAPEGGLTGGKPFALALGAALGIAMYDFLGYYDVCFLGDEVRRPERTIPRAVVISVAAVALIYVCINVGILGVLPAKEVASSTAIVTDLMSRVWGTNWGKAFTGLILWTAFASVFALLLGYSRIPYAAARQGYFFSPFAALHATEGFPVVSLLVLGAVTAGACWFPFMDVLTALLTSRILTQFVAQVGAVVAIRRFRPDIRLPFRMWLYPFPCLVALCGWGYIFWTSGTWAISIGASLLAAGVVAFLFFVRSPQIPPGDAPAS